MNPLNLQWHLRRLFGVLMVIIADQSSQLGLILQTIQNKYGLLQSSQTGVPCKKFIYLLSPADTWLCTRCDAKQGNLDDAHAYLQHMRRVTSFWRYLTLVLFGISMDFNQMLSSVIFHLHNLIIITSSAIYPWLSTHQYSWTDHTWYTPPTHQRHLQRSPCIMGWGIFDSSTWESPWTWYYSRHRLEVHVKHLA